MTTEFKRPVGSKADVKELEYISFLHQSELEIRTDGSIRDKDIKAFLMSRYGIDVPIEVVRDTILQGLGGGNDEASVIDLMELVTILLIPVFLKAEAASKSHSEDDEIDASDHGVGQTTNAHEQHTETPLDDRNDSTATYFQKVWKQIESCFDKGNNKTDEASQQEHATSLRLNTDDHTGEAGQTSVLDGLLPPPKNMIEFVSKMILHDITGDSKPKVLTAKLIKRILISYGEHALADDDELIAEMMACARPRETLENDNGKESGILEFDATTFSTGLTYDVQQYDIRNEVNKRTLYDDVYDDLIPAQLPLLTPENKFLSSPKTNATVDADTCSPENPSDLYIGRTAMQRKFTAPSIDITAGNYRSKILIMLLWSSAIMNFCYFYLRSFNDIITGDPCKESGFQFEQATPWTENSSAIACDTSVSILEWIIVFAYVGCLGLGFTAFGSIGNTRECRKWYHPLVGCIPVFIVTFYPTQNDEYLRVLTTFAFIVGLIVILLQISHTISIVVSEEFIKEAPQVREWLGDEKIEWLRTHLVPHYIEAERLAKVATASKLNRMVNNALYIVRRVEKETVSVSDTYYGQLLHAFAKYGERKKEVIGGAFWTWRKIRDLDLYKKDGVWFSVRVLASNVGQMFVCLFVAWGGIKLTQYTIDQYRTQTATEAVSNFTRNFLDQEIDEELVNGMTSNVSLVVGSYFLGLQDSGAISVNCTGLGALAGAVPIDTSSSTSALCSLSNNTQGLDAEEQLELLEATGLDATAIAEISKQSIQQATDAMIESLYPAYEYVVSVPMIIGTITAIITAVLLASTYLSSVASTTLKLRCGLIETLHKDEYMLYRIAPDTVALLTGALFWGCLASSVLTGSVFGLLTFFFLWHGTVYWAQKFVAIVIGILSITLIKLLVLLPIRKKFFNAYYREDPAYSNVGILALEWANFTLAAGIVFVRMIKLLLVTGFSVGRVNRPFLAEGVGRLGPIEFDGIPTVQVREILAHEAHRHPYIELLGTIYLMKLRYNEEFGKRAGSVWRLIFVHALMPWLQRYRIQARPKLMATPSGHVGAGSTGKPNSASVISVSFEPGSLQFTEMRRMPANRNEASMLRLQSNQDVGVEIPYQENEEIISQMLELKAENERLKAEIERLTIAQSDEASRFKSTRSIDP